MAEKRMKKNISFSEHEKDIYEYLAKQNNASALIKRLVYNHMIIERGIVAPITYSPSMVTQGTTQDTTTEDNKPNNGSNESNNESNNDVDKENKDGIFVDTVFSKEDLENKDVLPEL